MPDLSEVMAQLQAIAAAQQDQLAAHESLSSRLAVLETGQSAIQVPTVSQAEADARTAEAEAAVKVAKVQAEAIIEQVRICEQAETKREEIRAEATQEVQEAAVAIAEETGETPTVIPDNPGSQLPIVNSPVKRGLLERLMLGR